MSADINERLVYGIMGRVSRFMQNIAYRNRGRLVEVNYAQPFAFDVVVVVVVVVVEEAVISVVVVVTQI